MSSKQNESYSKAFVSKPKIVTTVLAAIAFSVLLFALLWHAGTETHSGNWAENYIVVRTNMGAPPAQEADHVIAEMSETYLLGYDSPDEAKRAADRITSSGGATAEVMTQFGAADASEAEMGDDPGYGEGDNPLAAAAALVDEFSSKDPTASGKEGRTPDSPLVVVLDSGAGDDVERYSIVGDSASDSTGHGISVISEIQSKAPGVRVVSVKVLDDNGVGSTISVWAGLQVARAIEADIVNMSLYAPRSGSSDLIDAAIAEAADAGIDVVVSAGNDSADAAGYIPASSPGALTAGSCDEGGHLDPISNFGDDVDVYVVDSRSTSMAAATTTGFLASAWGYDDALERLAAENGKGTFFLSAMPFGEELASAPENDTVSLPDDDPAFIGADTKKIKIATHTSGQAYYDSAMQGTCFRYTGKNVSNKNSKSKNAEIGTIAFCVVPPKGGIANGWYNSSTLTKARCSNKEAWYKLALAAMYYGYGGPGFNSTTKKWYPSKTYNKKTMTDTLRFASTHVLLSAIHLGGIGKAGASKSYQTWFKKNMFNTSNINSSSTYAGKLMAHYNDKDMLANGGYTMAEWAKCVFYMPTGGNMQDFMTYIPLKKNSVGLVKKSARPALTNGNSAYSLGGAVYGVYTTKALAQTHQADKALATYKTDNNGAFTSKKIFTHKTTYYIAEITPSKGFTRDPNVYTVTANKSSVKKVYSLEPVTLLPVSISLKAEKQLDRGTLKAGQFTFYLKDSDGNILQTKTNGADGKVVFDSITYSAVTTATYTIVEKEGDDPLMFYDTEPETVNVTVSDNGTKLVASVVYSRTGNSTPGTFTNTHVPQGKVTVKKVAAEDPDHVLRGAEFSVFSGTYSSGEDALANGTLVATGTTKADGIVTIEGLKIEDGGSDYTIVETKAPNGRYLDGDGDTVSSTDLHRYYRTFHLTDDNPSADFTGDPAKNSPKGAIVELEARKEFENGTLEAGAYTFELEALDGDDGIGPMPLAAGTSTKMVKENDASGGVFFGKVSFNDASYVGKTYLYRIREIIPEDAGTEIAYDDSVWICEVKVSLSLSDGETILTATRYYKDTSGASGAEGGN